jgi:hypothetical protein
MQLKFILCFKLLGLYTGIIAVLLGRCACMLLLLLLILAESDAPLPSRSIAGY